MAFSRRRGRPKKVSEGIDKGTAELRAKRNQNITTEPLDLCLNRGLITTEQHNAGIRFRWLYTLKFGAPTISSYSPDDTGGHSCKYEDTSWIARKQAEYNLIIQTIEKNKTRKTVMDICIFSLMPDFLNNKLAYLSGRNISSEKELNLLINGLDSINNLRKKNIK